MGVELVKIRYCYPIPTFPLKGEGVSLIYGHNFYNLTPMGCNIIRKNKQLRHTSAEPALECLNRGMVCSQGASSVSGLISTLSF